jgi:predicted GH43/DUF377 family glycosyl hydrolase
VLLNINYMLELDWDLAVRRIEPIVDRTTGPTRYRSQIQGYEDCRLFEAGARWYATATVCDLNPVERREIALLEFAGADIVAVRGLAGPHAERHEKNWMPFQRLGTPHLLYSCGPTIVLRCDPERGAVAEVSRREAPQEAANLRGGSQGVEVDAGHLFVVHEVDYREHALRYVHRFVLLDGELSLAALSRPFSFTSDRVEFCAGMARRGDELVLSFGVSDAAAGLATLELGQALALLEPVKVTTPPRRSKLGA